MHNETYSLFHSLQKVLPKHLDLFSEYIISRQLLPGG